MPARETMDYDIVIVGAGPAGLSAAIRVKQRLTSASVVVLEKGSEVGAHILSGAVLDPCGLDALIPDWPNAGAPVTVPVSDDRFYLLGEGGKFRIPAVLMPPLMHNDGYYVVSMGNVCRWLAGQAEALGVEIFPSMSCSALVYGECGEVRGVVAGEFGRSADGTRGQGYEPGVEVVGKYVLIAEGARGSLARKLIERHDLQADHEPQKFGLGMKELWEIDEAQHVPGRVIHTLGWPLSGDTGGGGFLYHQEGNQVSVGFVVHLNYPNPYLSPYHEFQRFKHHPLISEVLTGGRRIASGARVISEGGYQSMPRMVVDGAVLLGCSVGMVNLPRIKGNHNAMLSGIAAGDAVVEAIGAGRSGDTLLAYEDEVRKGAIGRDLKPVRNIKPLWSRLGTVPALVCGGLDMWTQALGGGVSVFGTLGHGQTDAEATMEAHKAAPIHYPKPDGVLSFDRTTSVAFSNTAHAEDQPCHLHLADPDIPLAVNLPRYAEPARRYCPAAVYEVVSGTSGDQRFVINFANCVHCKTCDIKDPVGNIVWTTPQGGDGPRYPNM